MQEKEAFGHNLAILFVVAAITLVLFLLPFDTMTGNFVFDIPSEKIFGSSAEIFYNFHLLYAFIVIVVAVLLMGGFYYIGLEKAKARKILLSLPAKKRLQLKKYVSDTLKQGHSECDIKAALVRQGWEPHYADAILRIF